MPTSWTLSGDTLCHFCNYEDHVSVTLTEPPADAPSPVTCENCGRESAAFLPDYTLTPSDPAADRQRDAAED